ncbi:MAG: MBL fold metallo-hydrolase [Paracoccaceae bacterium]|nr:MAG: MBL fold metallo-hydrolase [Paracoccaceae bacterium]
MTGTTATPPETGAATRPDRLVLLGVKGGPAIRARGAMPTSTLLDMAGQRIVIDCGLGVAKGLVEAGADLRTIDHIVITHLHSDHVLELGPLLHTAWTTGLARPVDVWGPPGIDVYWQGFLASLAYDITIRVHDEGRMPLADLVRLHVHDEGEVFAAPGLVARAMRVPHPPLEHCFAWRFDGAVSVTLSGDTAFHPPLAEFARGSAVLVHEAMLPEGIEAIIAKTGLGQRLRNHLHMAHSTVEQAARIARAAGAGRLVLNHLIPVDDPAFTDEDWLARAAAVWNGPVTVGRDGMEIEL